MSQLFKKILSFVLWSRLPRSLYSRFLLIIVLPVLVVQLVSIYVFYYSHLDVVSKHMARSVIAEMRFITDAIGKPQYSELVADFSSSVNLRYSFEQRKKYGRKEKVGDSSEARKKVFGLFDLFPLIDPLNRFKIELKNNGFSSFEIFDDSSDDDFFVVKVQNKNQIISFYVPQKRIASSTSHIFILWMLLTSCLTSYIAVAFLRNQIRPIKSLTNAAEKFGRGLDVPDFRPSGAREIRSLAISFLKMRERVMRQILQRTEMLSGVSHDLRTPLTRMKLQLEMMTKSEEVDELKRDIGDMEKLVDEYLNFVRGDDRESAQQIKIKKFLQEKIINYYAKMGKIIESAIGIEDGFVVQIKHVALQRALKNLIDNAWRYGDKVMLSASLTRTNLVILIDDNGCGIAEHERKNVLRPFYRLDQARNLDKKTDEKIGSSGSGLGLAIAVNAITSQGGMIKLLESPLGGLRVVVTLPV